MSNAPVFKITVMVSGYDLPHVLLYHHKYGLKESVLMKIPPEKKLYAEHKKNTINDESILYERKLLSNDDGK